MYLKRIIRYINDYDFEKVVEQIAQMKDKTLDESGNLIKFVLFNQFLNKLDFCKESLVENYEDEDLEKFRNFDWNNIYKKLIDIAKNIDENLKNSNGENIRLKIFTILTYSVGLYNQIEYNKNELLESIVDLTKDSNEKYKEDKQELIYSMAEAFIHIKKFDRAIDFINEIEDEDDEEDLMINYIDNVIECVKLDDVEKLIEEKVKEINSYYGLYSDLIKTYFKLGNEEKSKELLDKITESAEKIKDRAEREEALQYVVKALSSVKKVDEAIKLANKLSNKVKDDFEFDVRDYAFLSIILNLSEDFEFEQAEKLISKIKSEDITASAKLHIVRNLAKAGEYDKAIKIVDDMKVNSIQKELAIENIIKLLEYNNYNDRANELKEKYKNFLL